MPTDSLTTAIIGVIAASILSPAALWLILKGRMADWFVTKDTYAEGCKQAEQDLKGVKEQMEKDLNGIGAKVNENRERVDHVAAEVSAQDRRLIRVEEMHNGVTNALATIITTVGKIDEKLDRLNETTASEAKMAAVLAQRVTELERRQANGT